ncbi:hypothetical protein RU08_15510 [Pseudomonas fulva]|uniref:Uncharacterized protein n=1 Tax=Pseudomonas fulva TaxID=47880 RepID=A0A0D0KGI2_9PSED|nr:hypothetical protein RU08_15510 [Pseudomonas fulva]
MQDSRQSGKNAGHGRPIEHSDHPGSTPQGWPLEVMVGNCTAARMSSLAAGDSRACHALATALMGYLRLCSRPIQADPRQFR